MSLLSWLWRKKPLRVEPPVARPATPTARDEIAFTVPTGPFRFIALDVETTNSDPASICQLGLACVRHDGSIQVVSTLVDPGQPFSDFNVNLHGISPAKVRGAPRFPAILQQVSPILEQQLIVQHSTFDRSAINAACRAAGLPEPEWQWADSVQIARRAWPEFLGNGGHGLGHLKQALALDFEHHDAGEDAKAAALVVLRAEVHTGQTLEELVSPPKRAPRKSRPRRPAAPKINAADVEPHLEQLAALISLLTDNPPLSRAELEKRWEASSSSTISRMLETGETYGQASGAPAFLSLPEEDFREHLGSIDNDLGAQVQIVGTACRAYFDTGEIPAPYYAWRIAIILSKAKQPEHEKAFLAAWCRHFGATSGRRYEDLAERARKRGVGIDS